MMKNPLAGYVISVILISLFLAAPPAILGRTITPLVMATLFAIVSGTISGYLFKLQKLDGAGNLNSLARRVAIACVYASTYAVISIIYLSTVLGENRMTGISAFVRFLPLTLLIQTAIAFGATYLAPRLGEDVKKY